MWEIILFSITIILSTGIVTVKVFYPKYDFLKVEYIPFFRKDVPLVTNNQEAKRTRTMSALSKNKQIPVFKKSIRRSPDVFFLNHERRCRLDTLQVKSINISKEFHQHSRFSRSSTANVTGSTSLALYRPAPSSTVFVFCLTPVLIFILFIIIKLLNGKQKKQLNEKCCSLSKHTTHTAKLSKKVQFSKTMAIETKRLPFIAKNATKVSSGTTHALPVNNMKSNVTGWTLSQLMAIHTQTSNKNSLDKQHSKKKKRPKTKRSRQSPSHIEPSKPSQPVWSSSVDTEKNLYRQTATRRQRQQNFENTRSVPRKHINLGLYFSACPKISEIISKRKPSLYSEVVKSTLSSSKPSKTFPSLPAHDGNVAAPSISTVTGSKLYSDVVKSSTVFNFLPSQKSAVATDPATATPKPAASRGKLYSEVVVKSSTGKSTRATKKSSVSNVKSIGAKHQNCKFR